MKGKYNTKYDLKILNREEKHRKKRGQVAFSVRNNSSQFWRRF